MTLKEAAVQYLICQYARRGYCAAYFRAAGALSHLLMCTGDHPLAEVREKHFLMYFSMVVSEQARVPLADTRRRSTVSQLFWRWMKINRLVR